MLGVVDADGVEVAEGEAVMFVMGTARCGAVSCVSPNTDAAATAATARPAATVRRRRTR